MSRAPPPTRSCTVWSRNTWRPFLAVAAARTGGVGLPRFIERELRGFLRCGVLAHGFLRVRCDDCAFERLVPLSCKGRAVCASCGGRRMAEQAANLVQAVLPRVPVRQWVLTVPHGLRYRLAFDHTLCRAVIAVFVRAVLGWYRRRARRAGWADCHSGSVTVIQRFGSGLQLNVHGHALVLDGVFTEAADGTLRFHPAAAPNNLPPPVLPPLHVGQILPEGEAVVVVEASAQLAR
jgi:hypothetical protein